MGGVRFRISDLTSKQVSDFWTQISADFNWFYHSVYEISTVASPSVSTRKLHRNSKVHETGYLTKVGIVYNTARFKGCLIIACEWTMRSDDGLFKHTMLPATMLPALMQPCQLPCSQLNAELISCANTFRTDSYWWLSTSYVCTHHFISAG